jgi:hypothetical protein
MSGEPPVHPSAGEVAEGGVEVVRDAGTDASGVAVHGISREPIMIGEKKNRPQKEHKEERRLAVKRNQDRA